MKVIFFQVKDSPSKLTRIVQTAWSHFQKKERFLIVAPDTTAKEFVDALLWRYPEESFFPHGNPFDLVSIADQPDATTPVIFNLRPTPLLLPEPPKLLYELDDHSSPEKRQASHARYQAYRQAGYSISSG